ncbi:MAG TPA: signal peptidase II [Kofleriaceae bacterium]|jgi:signal peptidase II
MRLRIAFVAVVFVVVGFDQGSKAWARGLPTRPADCGVTALAEQHCAGVPQAVVDGFWDWELAENRGAAFSTFAGEAAGQILLALIAAGALVAIGIVAARTRPEQRMRRVGLALVGGGALGNLVDRVRDGSVTDFVRWHVHGHMWPIFNLADAALLVGVAILLVDGLVASRTLGRATA